VQLPAPASEYVPTGQRLATELVDPAGQEYPAEHGPSQVASVALNEALPKRPGLQGPVQDALGFAVPAPNRPAGQSVQVKAPAKLNLPRAQGASRADTDAPEHVYLGMVAEKGPKAAVQQPYNSQSRGERKRGSTLTIGPTNRNAGNPNTTWQRGGGGNAPCRAVSAARSGGQARRAAKGAAGARGAHIRTAGAVLPRGANGSSGVGGAAGTRVPRVARARAGRRHRASAVAVPTRGAHTAACGSSEAVSGPEAPSCARAACTRATGAELSRKAEDLRARGGS
jgi:hypothetical protein